MYDSIHSSNLLALGFVLGFMLGLLLGLRILR